MKKIVKIVILVIVILFLISRVYYFVVINKIYGAIRDFQDEKNRYYSVNLIEDSNKNSIKKEILVKDEIVKNNLQRNGIKCTCDFKDFKSNKEYSIDLQNRSFTESELSELQEDLLINLPDVILDIYQDDKFAITEFLKVKYVIPTEYKDEKCYKIVKNKQVLIISKDTYLPIYSYLKFMSSSDKSAEVTQYAYEFKVGEVTQEEIELPDLTGYTKMNEK